MDVKKFISLYINNKQKFWEETYKYYLYNIHIKNIWLLQWLENIQKSGKDKEIPRLVATLLKYPKLPLPPKVGKTSPFIAGKIAVERARTLRPHITTKDKEESVLGSLAMIIESNAQGKIKYSYKHISLILENKLGVSIFRDMISHHKYGNDRIINILLGIAEKYAGDRELPLMAVYTAFLYLKYYDRCNKNGQNFKKYFINEEVLHNTLIGSIELRKNSIRSS